MYWKTQGLVLREVAYRDTDKLLTVLTRDCGKMTLKARWVRRSRSPMKAACQLLACSEFTVFEYRGMSTVNEAQTVELFPELRADLELLSLGTYFAQVAEVLSQEDDPNPELLSLTLNGLYALGKLHRPQLLVKGAFELRAACLAGYAPDLGECRICGNPEPDRFILTGGCLECAGCHSTDGVRLPVTPGILAAMRYVTDCPSSKLFSFQLQDASLRAFSGLAERYLSTQLERGFTTLDFYHSLFPAMDTGDEGHGLSRT